MSAATSVRALRAELQEGVSWSAKLMALGSETVLEDHVALGEHPAVEEPGNAPQARASLAGSCTRVFTRNLRPALAFGSFDAARHKPLFELNYDV